MNPGETSKPTIGGRGPEQLPGSKLLTVETSTLRVSDDPRAVLVAYSLGSCIAVVVHDPARTVAGMLHYMLPLASVSPTKAQDHPTMFGETGIPLLFDRLREAGCRTENLVVKVAGGGSLHGSASPFDIGQRNHAVLRQVLDELGIACVAEDVGGAKSRTVRVAVGTGQVVVSARGTETEL